MTERTGLGPLELALLRSIVAVGGGGGEHVRTDTVLRWLDEHEGYGVAYGQRCLGDLAVPWQVPVRPVDPQGNWGSPGFDSMADPQYTEIALAEIGRLALAAEADQIGPVPIGLVNGSAYCGGRVPPLDPVAALRLVAALVAGEEVAASDLDGLIRLPTGGVLLDGLDDLVAGRSTRVVCSSRIVREVVDGATRLVVVGTPLGVDVDEVEMAIHDRSHDDRPRRAYSGSPDATWTPDPSAVRITDVRDETTDRTGTRIVISLRTGADVDAVETWVRAIWPVTIEVDWYIEGGLHGLLTTWADRCRLDPSGLRRLLDLI